jgi:hypothetical protein
MENYRQTCLRAASILVTLGHPAERITALANVVAPVNVRDICQFLARRNQRKEGGAPFQMALILYIAAKHHVRLPAEELTKLERFWRAIRGPFGKMSQRTFRRLEQFDDQRAMIAMAQLPVTLMKAAARFGQPSVRSAKLVRTALFLSLAQDTALRAGNLVSVDVHQHLSLEKGRGRVPVADLVIPGSEVKNGVDVATRLTGQTAKILQIWLKSYRATSPMQSIAQSLGSFPTARVAISRSVGFWRT